MSKKVGKAHAVKLVRQAFRRAFWAGRSSGLCLHEVSHSERLCEAELEIFLSDTLHRPSRRARKGKR